MRFIDIDEDNQREKRKKREREREREREKERKQFISTPLLIRQKFHLNLDSRNVHDKPRMLGRKIKAKASPINCARKFAINYAASNYAR